MAKLARRQDRLTGQLVLPEGGAGGQNLWTELRCHLSLRLYSTCTDNCLQSYRQETYILTISIYKKPELLHTYERPPSDTVSIMVAYHVNCM